MVTDKISILGTFKASIYKLVLAAQLTSLSPTIQKTGFLESSRGPLIYRPLREKTCLQGFSDITGADRPAHPHSLLNAFVVRLLKCFISSLATSELLASLCS